MSKFAVKIEATYSMWVEVEASDAADAIAMAEREEHDVVSEGDSDYCEASETTPLDV